MFPPVEPLSPAHDAILLALKIALIPIATLTLLLHAHQFRARAARRGNKIIVLSVSPAQQSPRAIAHARAIAQHTQFIPVFVAEPPFPQDTSPVVSHPLQSPPPQPENRTPFVLLHRLISGVISLVSGLDSVLDAHPGIAAILLNTPPSLPTIVGARVWLFFRAPAAKLIVDWHNTACSILSAHSVNPHIVGIIERLERFSALLAHEHWCVTEALREDLPCSAVVVRDAPPDSFQPTARQSDGTRLDDPRSVHELLQRVAEAAGSSHAYSAGETALTRGSGSKWRSDAEFLLVSSTSWTPDEDFEPLLDAICDVDAQIGDRRILLVITGRGPLRAQFETKVAKLALRNVRIWCAWLTREDYAALLAAAHIGISMHKSSSGLDLPMKAVDMLGCGTPVISCKYRCIGELVKDGENGLLFNNAEELSKALMRTMVDDGSDALLRRLRQGAVNSFGDEKRWMSAWRESALPSLMAQLNG